MDRRSSRAETIYARTRDGWGVALHHYEGSGKRRHPVIMLHGLGANASNLDLSDDCSLARAARDRGFDVFLLDFRGAGLSRAPEGEASAAYQWGFKDYVRSDLPAAVALVLERTGAMAFHGVGHSMGGMVLYSHATSQPAHLKSVAALGAPLVRELRLGRRERRLFQIASRLASPRGNGGRRVPLKRLMGTAGTLLPLAHRLVDPLLINGGNVEPKALHAFARKAINDIPSRLLLELTEQMGHEKTGGNDAYYYENELHRVEVPILAVGGSADRIAPPASVAAGLRAMGSGDVRYREMGCRHGDRADYGHIDLLIGRTSPEEVFPVVLDFLEEMD